MKLGVACVYFYGEDGGWILDLQTTYIASTLRGYDYTIYAGANRLHPQLRNKLAMTPGVQIIPLPDFDGKGGPEHAFYLDHLLWKAASDGCTHIAALDCDSFPLVPDWPQILLHKMGAQIRMAAVLRAENRDTHLPHPCGYFMRRVFLLDHRPKLLPSDDEQLAERFQTFLRNTRQRIDTGIGYAYALWNAGEDWLPLLRSNKRNRHFLMAGIYGGIFFHLGASSRTPAFHIDYVTKPALRLSVWLRDLPLLWRLAARLEGRYLAANGRIYEGIANSLRSDPESFLSYLSAGQT